MAFGSKKREYYVRANYRDGYVQERLELFDEVLYDGVLYYCGSHNTAHDFAQRVSGQEGVKNAEVSLEQADSSIKLKAVYVDGKRVK